MLTIENIKVGLFGIGLDKYWDQFEGLYNRLSSYQNIVKSKIEAFGVTVIDAGLIDNPRSATDAGEYLKQNDIEILFLFISTYALSSTVLPIVQKVKVPVIILNLQPLPAIDYPYFNTLKDREKMTGEWLAHCQSCSLPEIASVFNRANIQYEIVSGYLNDKLAWREIEEWVNSAKVVRILRNNRMGILGHYYNGMLDVYTDITKLTSVFGTHFELIEMCEVKKYRDQITSIEIDSKINEFKTVFDVSHECSEEEIIRAAKTSIALDKLVFDHDINSLAYYYEGEIGNEYENIVTSLIAGTTLLTGKNIPIAGECEVKNAHAMKIIDAFSAGGSFSEFYAIDFNEDIVLMGHDGPAHFAISQGRVNLVPLQVYHGKPGKGLSIQMTVKHGPVTILSVVEGIESIFLLIAEGDSVPGPILKIGNTNSRYHFSIGVKEFINSWSKKGPSHHCAIGIGHIASAIEKLGKLLNIPVVRVC